MGPMANFNNQDTITAQIIYEGRVYDSCVNRISEDSVSLSTDKLFGIDVSVVVECEPLEGKVVASAATITKITHIAGSDPVKYDLQLRWEMLSDFDRGVIREYCGILSKRRREERYVARLSGRMLHPILIDNLEISNVSNSGMFISTDIPIPPNTFLRFELNLGRNHLLIDSRATHMISTSASKMICSDKGCGVTIVELPEEVKTVWSRYIMGKHREMLRNSAEKDL